MALFGNNRIFTSRGGAIVRSRGRRQVVAWGLIGVAAGLLGAGRFEPSLFDAVRGPLAAVVAPVVATVPVVLEPVNRVVARGVSAFTHFSAVDSLRAENARLTAQAARAVDLERENTELKRLAKFAGAPSIARVSARVVASSPSALSRTLLIDAGRNRGVRDGFPVVGGDGLLGRVVQAGDDMATVRLLSDRLSRVPVYIGRQQARGLLTGLGNGSPRLEFVAGGVAVDAGDAQNGKGERESAGSRLKAVVK
ncbi:MAG: rod shape-determining protein MreC [Hyphomicrobiaceae bacterium]